VWFADADLQFLASAVAGDDERAAASLLQAWRADPTRVEAAVEDDRVVRRLLTDQRLLVKLSPRFLFAVLLSCIRRDLSEIPYTVERVHADGRVVVFDAALSLALLRSREIFDYLVDLLVSFERVETLLVSQPFRTRRARRLSTLSIDDMLELAGVIDPPMRSMVFRRIGDIALFTTGLFPEAVLRGRRPSVAAPFTVDPPRRRVRIEDYEAEGRRFYRLAANRLVSSQPDLAGVLMRLSDEFTAARKPLTVLAERYIAWVRPHWTQLPS
jgi:hypothetical protein